MKPYTACYCRVSGKKQKTDSQRHEISKYIKQHRIKVKWFQDKKSGRTTRRSALQQIIADCRSGLCDQLIMYKLDRLSRNCRQTLELVQDLVDHGVKIVCVSQGLTFDSSPMGIFTLQIWAAVSELESNHLSERIKAGLSACKNKGGATPDKRKRQRVQKMLDKGMTLQEMSDKLGVTRGSVYGMIRRMRAA